MDEQRRAIERVARAYFDEDIEVTEARRRRQGLGLRLDGKITKEVAIFLGENPHPIYKANTPYIGQQRTTDEHFTTDGRPRVIVVGGRCKTWKSRPLEWSLPIKIGFKGKGKIDHGRADLVTTNAPLPFLHAPSRDGRRKFLCHIWHSFGLLAKEIPVKGWDVVTCGYCLAILNPEATT